MTSMTWTATDLPDLRGRTAVVTGANSGLGRVTARELARAGAHVVLAVRDEDKGHAAARDVGGSSEVRRLDLADLTSVRAFAEDWSGELDLLVNNAGIMATPLSRTADGFEAQLGTNHLGHFALTNLLLEGITGRVVTLSSGMHRSGTIDADLNWDQRTYDPWQAYAQSKLANLLFTLELQRRLTLAGSPVRSLAAHPGFAATNLHLGLQSTLTRLAMAVGTRLVAQSDEGGALPTLFAATRDLPGATYVGPGGTMEARGAPALVGRSAAASDPVTARRLWERSEELTGVSWPLPAR